jgi:AAA domain-containing protein
MSYTVDKLAEKGFSKEYLLSLGIRDAVRDGETCVEIPYYDRAGNEWPRIRLRYDAARMHRWSPGDAPAIPYGLHRPVPYDKGILFIPEGESDCWALWKAGLPALGLPGATNTSCLRLEHIADVKAIYVIQEPGAAGAAFPARVGLLAYSLGFEGVVYALALPQKDPRELMLATGEGFKDAMRAALKGRKRIERPAAKVEVAIRPPAEPVFMTSDDLLDEPEDRTEWLVEGILPQGGILLMCAAPKAGKTILTRNLALAVCRGGKVLDRQCAQGSVLWLALEEPKSEAKKIIEAMGFRGLPLHSCFGHAPLEVAPWLEGAIDKLNPKLIVIDTWHKLTMIENINDYAAVNRSNALLQQIARERNIAQVWIHHNKKGPASGGEEVLGSAALFAAADTLMSIKRGDDGVRSVSTIQRFGSDLPSTVVQMNEANYLLGDGGGEYDFRVRAALQKILDALAVAGEPMTRNEICEAVTGRRGVTLTALARLQADGLITQAAQVGRGPAKFVGTAVPERGIAVPEAGISRSSNGIAGTHGIHGTQGTEGTGEGDLLEYAMQKFFAQ